MKILIVDDDIFVTTSLKTILEANSDIKVVGVGNDGAEGVRLYKELQPDVCLMDIRMKDIDGIEASRLILEEDPNAKILLLTTFQDDEYIISALKLGTKGYLLKQDYDSLVPSINAVLKGQSVFGKDITNKIPSLLQEEKTFNYESFGITKREFDIIKHISDGLNNKEIADKLYLSEGTVRNYLSNILEKLNLRDRTQVAVFYYQNK